MTRGLKRYYGRGELHFLTFSCHRRLPLLGRPKARDLFVSVLGKMRSRYGFPLIGYVVMPEHVHLLVGEPPGSTPSKVLQSLKQRVSRDLRGNGPPKRAGDTIRGVSASALGHPRFWQPRFYDFNVHNTWSVKEKLNYMHANPVKRGLVRSPGEWAWSSYLYYAKGEVGLVAIDRIDGV